MIRMPENLILASTSKTRQALLHNAGIAFTAMAPNTDEASLKTKHQDQPAHEMALILAKAKALSLAPYSHRPVLGADQTLLFDGKIFDKPQNLDEAKSHLRQLSGQTHILQSAMAIAENNTIIWTSVNEAKLTMRKLSATFIDEYVAREAPHILHSVGAYQLEASGIQLFDKIEGDYFTILGLPLLPLLQFLRHRGIVPT
jgi:septum formation protein